MEGLDELALDRTCHARNPHRGSRFWLRLGRERSHQSNSATSGRNLHGRHHGRDQRASAAGGADRAVWRQRAVLPDLLSGHWLDAGLQRRHLAMHQRALAIQEKALGPESSLVGASLEEAAFVMLELHQYADALARFSRALAIFEKAYGREHIYLATSLVG